jgi:hypothetical protein
MNSLPDVSGLSASEVTELINKCTQRLDELRQQHMQEASLLGLHCALPEAKERKPRRNSSKQQTAD